MEGFEYVSDRIDDPSEVDVICIMIMWDLIQFMSYLARRSWRMRYMLKVQSIGASFDPCLLSPEAVNRPTRSLWGTQYSCFMSHEWTRCRRSGFKSNKLSARTTRARLMGSNIFSRSNETWMPPHRPSLCDAVDTELSQSGSDQRPAKGNHEYLGWEGMQKEAWF